MARFGVSALIAATAFSLHAAAQLTGSVGPLTDRAAKAAIKTCNIMDYGGVADATTDNSQAISDAWDACAATGGEVYIPEGDYGLSTWLKLSGDAMSFRLDGTIYRIGTDGGNMLFFQHMQDFEFYSSTSKGAIQGYGYEFHKNDEYGPRILRFYDVTSFSIHDVALVDSPAFHFSLDTCTDGEVYNMVIHGGNRGGLDGIDVWGTNIWIHDLEVSNKDECVTVKNPSNNLLIENIFCNWSGGCAMGSLGTDTAISNIIYNNVYTQNANQMFMFKSYGGSGTVSNVQLNNFIGHSNAYTLDLDATWSSMSPIDGDGILYTNFTFAGWAGTCLNGHQRGPIKFNCPPDVPCTEMVVDDFNVWTEEGDYVEHWCNNAYGSGVCLDEGSGSSTFTTTQTVTAVTDYTIATMDNEISTGLGLTVSIPIPTLRASFYPGVAVKSALMAAGDSEESAETTAAAAASSAVAASSSVLVASSAAAVVPTSVAAVESDVQATTPVFAVSDTAPADGPSFVSIVTSTPTSFPSASDIAQVTEATPVVTPSAVVSELPVSSGGSSACNARRRRRHLARHL
ncbi:pectin lyase fold/virulence factor [Dactylonectria macrodidyma]|uniref:Pectin lyase fold/virulence factor n=1 Tax=Dactylonectria macrodidyma TaxID=307937 RepID=A0A9P9IMT7_9HYPO|nr:pectin lyase fold/virulence factor [Dactylonectria macrodidyma]